jgi:tRNA(fMet)-specific endonuclease VapC
MAELIDSSVFIELERRRLPAGIILDTTDGAAFALAAITASELLVGVERADSSARRLRRERIVERVLASVPILSFDLAVARVHARLWAELRGAGQMIGPHDLLIAATALAGSHSILTHNLREFARVPGLVVRQPRW